MTEPIQVPEITPTPPPDIQPSYKGILEYIHLGDDVRAFKNSLQDAAKALLYVPVVGWAVYGAIWILTETLLGILAFIGDVIDGLWNGIVDIVNSLYIWFTNFQRAVQERYNGNWAKAIIDVVVKIILMSALNSALNIPAIKQFWDTFVAVVKKINDWLLSVRNWIEMTYKNMYEYVSGLVANIDPIVRYIFRSEIEFWTGQINSLLYTVRGELMKYIDRVDKVLTSKFEYVINQVNEMLREYNELVKSIPRRVGEALIDKVITLVASKTEEEVWLEEVEKGRTYSTEITYSMPGQVESTYKTTVRVNDIHFSPQIFVKAILAEFFTEGTPLYRQFVNNVREVNDYFDSLFSDKEEWLSMRNALESVRVEFEEAKEYLDTIQEREGIK